MQSVQRYLPYLALLLTTGAAGYFYWQTTILTRELATTSEERDLTEAELATTNETLTNVREELAVLGEDYETLREEYRDERNRNEDFQDQINDLTGTIGNLNKLAETDEELLQKYSKVYFLNENYTPEDIEEIDEEWILEGREPQFFHEKAWPFLEDLLEDAERDDIDLKVVSAYRSFDEQTELKGQFTQVYGSGANTFSADQGYSEHQLGTTVDLTVESVGGAYTSFAQTEAYKWLQDNAHKHGFILSYPEGNEYYVFEPWHWRFVGEDLARDLHRHEESFYDLSQREIDEYLITIFD